MRTKACFVGHHAGGRGLVLRAVVDHVVFSPLHVHTVPGDRGPLPSFISLFGNAVIYIYYDVE